MPHVLWLLIATQALAPGAIHATTPAAIAAIRASLVGQIWPVGTCPTRIAESVELGIDPGALESRIPPVNLARVDRYTVTTNNNVVRPFLLRPAIGTGHLALVAIGHTLAGTMGGSRGAALLVHEALVRGNTVLLVPMPNGGTAGHDRLGAQGTPAFHPMAYFLDPAIVALNTYLAQNPAPTQIVAAGMSGGG